MKKIIVTAALVAGFAIAGSAQAAFTWTPGQSYIRVGSRGAQVMELQSCMNGLGFTTGVVDGIFGQNTAAGVRAFQANNGLTADAIVGPMTAPKFVAACSGEESSNSNSSNSSSFDTTSGDEASLEKYNMKDGDEDVIAEGDEEEIAIIEFDVEDGDVLFERLDLTFVKDGATGEKEPWDAFDTITLMADGDEIASEAVDDEDDWLTDDEPFTFRFSGLDYVVDEGDKAKISVMIEAASSVDDSDQPGDNDWFVFVEKDGIRGVDTAGLTQYIGDDGEYDTDVTTDLDEYVSFGIENEGAGEDIKFRTSSDDPTSSILKVEEDEVSDEQKVFVFELESEDRDIDIDTLTLDVTTGTAVYDNVVDDIWVVIDGDKFDDYDVTGGNTTTGTVEFDIDGDYTVDSDDRVDVEVYVEFKKQDGNYTNGTETITVETVEVTGEGVDDVDDTTSISSATHTLNISPATISDFAWDTNSAGTILDFTFNLEAGDDEDFDIVLADVDQTEVSDTTSGVGAPVLTVSGGASADYVVNGASDFTIKAGKEVTLRLRYSVTAPVAGDNGKYFEIKVENVAGTEVPTNKQSKTSTVSGL